MRRGTKQNQELLTIDLAEKLLGLFNQRFLRSPYKCMRLFDVVYDEILFLRERIKMFIRLVKTAFFLATCIVSVEIQAQQIKPAQSEFKRYPPCTENGKPLVFDVKKPYKKCFLDLTIDVSGRQFVLADDSNEVVYNVNIENFPLDGFAEIIWPSGARYLGFIKAGLPFGKGKIFFPESWPFVSYVGEFSNVISKSFTSNEDWNPIYDDSFQGKLDYLFVQEDKNKRSLLTPYLIQFSFATINGDGELLYRDGRKASGFFWNGVKQNDR